MAHRFFLSFLLVFVGLVGACSENVPVRNELSIPRATTVATTGAAATGPATTSMVPLPTTTTTTITTPTVASTTTMLTSARMIETLEPDGFTEDRLVAHLVPEVLGDELRPLVIVLHAYGGVAETAIGDFGLRDAAAEGGWIVLAPSGLVDSTGRQYWNATATCCDRDRSGTDDVEYLRQIILAAMIRYPVDPARVVVIGGSNGGFMAYQLACHTSEIVSAIVVLAATEANSERACQPRYPVSVFHVHGTRDRAVKFDGGELSLQLEQIAPYPSAEVTVGRWALRNGCPTEQPDVGLKLGAVVGAWLNCELGTSIRFAWLDQGHDVLEPPWPGDAILGFVAQQVRAPLHSFQ